MAFEKMISSTKGRLGTGGAIAQENAKIRCTKGHAAWLQKESGCTHVECREDDGSDNSV